jgi:hypothetical protein
MRCLAAGAVLLARPVSAGSSQEHPHPKSGLGTVHFATAAAAPLRRRLELRHERPEEAAMEYRATLKTEPNRWNSFQAFRAAAPLKVA